MTEARPKVLIIHTHPVQYLAPLFRRYTEGGGIDLTVAYCNIPSVEEGMFDAGYGARTPWGLDLLDGYRHVELRSWGRQNTRTNPDVVRLILRERFDLVVAYGYNFGTSWLSLFATKCLRARWVFVSDNFTLESQEGKHRPWKRLFLTALSNLADGVIAQSRRSAEFYADFFEAVELVPHAIDDERFATGAGEPAEIPNRNPDDTVFLYVGKLIPRKRVQDAIRAVSKVENAILWIVGLGPDEAGLRNCAAEIGSRVSFLGFKRQAELPAIYAAADALVLPSSVETFGLVVSEAASVGIPAIVSDACGAVGSIVFSGLTGEVVPVGDVDELATAMTRLSDDGYRERLTRNLVDHFAGWTAVANSSAFGAAVHRFVESGPRARGKRRAALATNFGRLLSGRPRPRE